MRWIWRQLTERGHLLSALLLRWHNVSLHSGVRLSIVITPTAASLRIMLLLVEGLVAIWQCYSLGRGRLVPARWWQLLLTSSTARHPLGVPVLRSARVAVVHRCLAYRIVV